MRRARSLTIADSVTPLRGTRGVTTHSYDGRNVLSWLVNPFAERTTWLYDALGRVTTTCGERGRTMTHANGAVAEHDYDAAGRITALRNLKSDRSLLSLFAYSPKPSGTSWGEMGILIPLAGARRCAILPAASQASWSGSWAGAFVRCPWAGREG